MRALTPLLLVLVALMLPMIRSFSFKATPATKLQPTFPMINGGWLGADVATSLPLGGGRYLWLWGDTLVGTFGEDGVRKLTAFPRNSLSLLNVSSATLLPTGTLSHLLRYNHSEPFNESIGFFTPDNPKHWYWPTSGISLLPWGYNEVVLFASTVTKTGTGSFGFSLINTVALRISNTDGEPSSWKIASSVLPFSGPGLSWASAAAPGAKELFLLGTQHNNADAVLAKIGVEELRSFSWEKALFWSIEEGKDWREWKVGALFPIFSNPPPETTLQYHPLLEKWFILSIPFLKSQVYIRTASTLTGVWEETLLYDIPAPFNNTDAGIFCYAPKSHVEFAAADEIVFSFMSNAGKLSTMLETPRLYIPQFVRVKIVETELVEGK